MRDWNYRHYVANSLMYISEKSAFRHYIYTLDEILHKKVDTRSAEEITADVVKNAGITLID